jgi:hypothetical protein
MLKTYEKEPGSRKRTASVIPVFRRWTSCDSLTFIGLSALQQYLHHVIIVDLWRGWGCYFFSTSKNGPDSIYTPPSMISQMGSSDRLKSSNPHSCGVSKASKSAGIQPSLKIQQLPSGATP